LFLFYFFLISKILHTKIKALNFKLTSTL